MLGALVRRRIEGTDERKREVERGREESNRDNRQISKEAALSTRL